MKRPNPASHFIPLLSLAILATFTALTLKLGLYARGHLSTRYSVKQFYPQQHPLIEADNRLKEKFILDSGSALWVSLSLPESIPGSWSKPELLHALSAFTDEAAGFQGVKRAQSLSNVEGASTTQEGITVGKLVALTAPDQLNARVLNDPLLTPGLLSKDGRTALVGLELDATQTNDLRAIMSHAEQSARHWLPEAILHIGGVPAIQVQMASVLEKELRRFLVLAILACALTLVAFFHDWTSTLSPLILILFSNVFSLAWMASRGIPFTVLSTTLPILVSIIVLSMSTHSILEFAADWARARERNPEANQTREVLHAFRAIFLPNLLMSLTTCVGFGAMAFTDVGIIHDYAVSVSVAVMISWACVTIGLPALLCLLPPPRPRQGIRAKSRWALHVMRRRRGICLAILGACTLFSWKGQHLNWSVRLFDDLPAGEEARVGTELIDEKLGGTVPLELMIRSTETDAWNEPARARTLEKLLSRWRLEPGVGSAVGLPDFLRAASVAQGKAFPSSRPAVAELIFIYSFAGEPILSHFLTADGTSTRISLKLHDIPADEMRALSARVSAEARAAFPGMEVTPFGSATTVHEINQAVSKELIYGFWQALLLISALLLVIYRSVRWTLIAAVPNLIPPLVLIGTMGMASTPIKPSIGLLFSIALGIAYNNTVYLLGRVRTISLRRHSSRLPIQEAWYEEGNPCVFSTFALFGGFAVFLASYFSVNQTFGAYMLLSLIAGMVGDLVFLPALLGTFPKLLPLPTSITRQPLQEYPMLQRFVVATSVLICLHPVQLFAETPLTAGQILDRVQKNMNSHDETAVVEMTIGEASGSQKVRAMEIKRRSDGGKNGVMVRLQSPADLKGTALLSVGSGAQEDQWLYLPSAKQSRRIVSSNKSSNFLDSELSYEDMGTASGKSFQNRIVKEGTVSGRKFTVIESIPKSGESSYAKMVSWVSQPNFLVERIEYYDRGGKLLKVSQMLGYKQFTGGVWRAQKVVVQNAQNKRSTIMALRKLEVNRGLSSDDFSQTALADD